MSSRFTTSVAVHFEAAHRLPETTGRCHHLHGHSWTAIVFLGGPDRSRLGSLIDGGAFRMLLSEWIDRHLDHATMLGGADPLLGPLSEHESRIFVFEESTTPGMRWPTAENIAALLFNQADAILMQLIGMELDAAEMGYLSDVATAEKIHVAGVRVRDSAANSVTFTGERRVAELVGA